MTGMPRLVDHEERRRTITGAVRRVVARAGLEAATFQAVAAEAGVSVRLVQYYFGGKEELLRATHRAVIEDAGLRFGAGSPPREGPPPPPREVLRVVLEALLPLDAERRNDAVVLAAFHAASLTDPHGRAGFLLGAPGYLVDVVAGQLARARPDDHEGASDGTTLDARLVVATVAGITQGMLPGFYSDDEARALVEQLLDRVLGPDDERASDA